MSGLVRALWCRLRRRHRLAAGIHGEVVLVGCAACRVGREVPLAVPATTPPPETPFTVEKALAMGCVLVDGYTFLELQLTAQVERAFAAVDEPW